MQDSLLTLKRQVEKVTALGLSWDTAVQLLLIAGLTEVSSQLEALNKALSANGQPSSGHGTPSPAPQNEAEGVQRGKETPKFEFAPNPIHAANGAQPPARRDGSSARHPSTKKFTNR